MTDSVEVTVLQNDPVFSGEHTIDPLVAAAKDGDQNSFSKLVIQLLPVILYAASRYGQSEPDREDLRQEGLLGLLAAVRSYKIEKGASFRTYASSCIFNAIISASRRTHHVSSAAPSFQELSSSENVAEWSGTDADPEALLIAREQINELREELLNVLTALEYQVLSLHMLSYHYDEIARQLGVSVKSVDNAIQRMRRKLSKISSLV